MPSDDRSYTFEGGMLGAIIGAMLGGPIGAIFMAIVGAWMGKRYRDEQRQKM